MTHYNYKFSRRRYDLASIGVLLEESQTAAELGDMVSARWAIRQAKRILRNSSMDEQFLEDWLEQILQIEASLLPNGWHSSKLSSTN
jgi:hypothetical protein